MRIHLITSFTIIVSIALTSSINIKTWTYAVEPNKHVTKEFLTNICSKSSNSSLCMAILKDLIGHPLAKTTISTLAIRPITKAQSHARETHKMIGTIYRSLIDPSFEVRGRYQRCLVGYDDAIKFLADAKRYAKRGIHKQVRSYASSAMNRVNSCDDGFKKPPKEPLTLKNANKTFKDLCDIIVAICNKI